MGNWFTILGLYHTISYIYAILVIYRSASILLCYLSIARTRIGRNLKYINKGLLPVRVPKLSR